MLPIITLALLFQAAGPVAAETAPVEGSAGKAAPPPSIVQASWVRLPSARDLQRAYPTRAGHTPVDGYAVTTCKVTGPGVLIDCAVAEEAPAGRGFGAAALRLMPLFQMRATTSDGRAVEGGTVRIPLYFIAPR